VPCDTRNLVDKENIQNSLHAALLLIS